MFTTSFVSRVTDKQWLIVLVMNGWHIRGVHPFDVLMQVAPLARFKWTPEGDET